MSGICGIIRFDSQSVKTEEIQKMLNAMENHGKDMEGNWIYKNVGFGHKMLWTTPESLHEIQPIVSKDKNLVITSDARIDNRDELFKKLGISENGIDVVTDSDLILLAYQKWGKDSPKYLIGDYAYAIWDSVKKELFCVRDALGIKPFYYYLSDKWFVFASEIQSLYSLKGIKKEFNVESIRTLLLKRTLRHEDTLFLNVMRLPVMHSMTLLEKKLSFSRYWFPEKIKENRQLTFENAVKKFNSLFYDSVNACLRGQYPIGCELSGGLDSSSVFGIAVGIKGSDNVTSFSYRYGDLSCDEGEYIDAVTKKFNSNKNIAIRVDKLNFSTQCSLKRFHQERKEWPGMAVFLSHFSIIEEARKKGIRIMLTGQGGDHILTGNESMMSLYLKRKQFLYLWYELKAYNFAWSLIKSHVLAPVLPDWIRLILGKKRKYVPQIGEVRPLSMFEDMTRIRKYISDYQWFEIGLVAGMHHSHWADNNPYQLGGRYDIEFRHPFFNRKLVEFSLSLPPYMKMQHGLPKNLLRIALADILPNNVLQRIDKAEFSPELNMQLLASKSFKDTSSPLNLLSIMSVEELKKARELNDWQVQLLENWLDYHS